jgi:vitamin B12/bleomycin/antimicrobial peptide transport system ATP-binding/permease protein
MSDTDVTVAALSANSLAAKTGFHLMSLVSGPDSQGPPVDIEKSTRGPPERRAHANAAQAFLRLSLGFWSGKTRVRAWLLTLIVLLFLLANLAAALAINLWNKYFFDALERKDTGAVLFSIGLILAIALFSAAGSVGLLNARMRLQVRWRQWLTRTLISRWLANRHFYQLTIVGSEAENPEARIAEDGRLAIELLVEFLLGVLNAVLAAVSFIGILWVVGGALTVAGYSIPGYMVFACIAYSTLTTLAMFLLARPLVRCVEAKAAGEAQLRYELTRVKDNAEFIALTGGDGDERKRLDVTLSDLVKRWIGVIVWQGRMMWLNGANLVLAPVLPLLLGAPKYLAGDMTLGSLVQAATAFIQVQVALNWLADNAMRLADWFASSHRVSQLSDAIDRLEERLGPVGEGETITIGVSPDDRLHLRQLNITLHDGKLMIDGAEAIISRGEKVLVQGESGTGKSTLIRAMAGLWPWGSGEILLPAGAEIAFMPQRPYFPLGTLRTALLYPHPDQAVADDKIQEILVSCGLEHLVPRLDDTEPWSSALSGGEQQRLAFARVLIRPPDILVMDEPTSSLDELSQFKLMEYMRDRLAGSMVIHAGHRPGLERFHGRQIKLVRAKLDGPTTTREHRTTPREFVAHALKGIRRPHLPRAD